MATPFQCTFFISKLLKSFKKAIKSCLWLPDKMWAFFGPNMTHNYSAPSVLDKACVHICLSSSCFSTKRFSTLHEPWYKQTCVHRYEVSTKSKILVQKQSQPIVFQFVNLGGSIQWIPRIPWILHLANIVGFQNEMRLRNCGPYIFLQSLDQFFLTVC